MEHRDRRERGKAASGYSVAGQLAKLSTGIILDGGGGVDATRRNTPGSANVLVVLDLNAARWCAMADGPVLLTSWSLCEHILTRAGSLFCSRRRRRANMESPPL